MMIPGTVEILTSIIAICNLNVIQGGIVTTCGNKDEWNFLMSILKRHEHFRMKTILKK